jgi:hypothetical protein
MTAGPSKKPSRFDVTATSKLARRSQMPAVLALGLARWCVALAVHEGRAIVVVGHARGRGFGSVVTEPSRVAAKLGPAWEVYRVQAADGK